MVGETEVGEFGVGHPEGLLGDVGSGLESCDPVMMMTTPFANVAGLGFRRRHLRADGGVDEGKDLGLVEPLEAHVLVDVPGAGIDVLGEVASPAHRTETEGGGGQALGDPVLSESVEEGRGGAVSRLPVIAKERGQGAEHEEEVEVGEDVVEVPGAFDLWRDHCSILFVA